MEALGQYRASNMLERPEEYLAILMYHGIEERPEIRALRRQDIGSDSCIAEVRFFKRQGYRPVRPGEWQKTGGEGAKLLVTFDDAHLNTFDLLQRLSLEESVPVLVAVCPEVVESGEPFWWEEVSARLALSRMWQKWGSTSGKGLDHSYDSFLMAHYFTPRRRSGEVLEQVRRLTRDVSPEQVTESAHVHSNMTWCHLAELAATGLCTFAAHSLAHEAATHMSLDEFERDASQCRETIEAKLGIECRDYVYPFGSSNLFSEGTEAILRAVGYTRSYTTEHRINYVHEWMGLGRFTGTGLDVSARYYEYLWRRRHLSHSDGAASPL